MRILQRLFRRSPAIISPLSGISNSAPPDPLPADYSTRPFVCRFEVGERTWEVEQWTDRQWSLISETDRPDGVSRLYSDDGWVRLTRIDLGPIVFPVKMVGESTEIRVWSPEAWINHEPDDRETIIPGPDGWRLQYLEPVWPPEPSPDPGEADMNSTDEATKDDDGHSDEDEEPGSAIIGRWHRLDRHDNHVMDRVVLPLAAYRALPVELQIGGSADVTGLLIEVDAPPGWPDLNPTLPESDPDPDYVSPPAPGILRDVVVRLIDPWESTRIAAENAKNYPDFNGDDEGNDLRAMVDAVKLAERTAREIEAMLGKSILHLSRGWPVAIPVVPLDLQYALEANRRAAVTHRGITYAVVLDPHSSDVTMPIVARVEPGRAVAIG